MPKRQIACLASKIQLTSVDLCLLTGGLLMTKLDTAVMPLFCHFCHFCHLNYNLDLVMVIFMWLLLSVQLSPKTQEIEALLLPRLSSLPIQGRKKEGRNKRKRKALLEKDSSFCSSKWVCEVQRVDVIP